MKWNNSYEIKLRKNYERIFNKSDNVSIRGKIINGDESGLFYVHL